MFCLMGFSGAADPERHIFQVPGKFALGPAAAMPPWLAHLTPWLDDAPSGAAWSGVIARYVRVLPRLLALAPERRARLDYECRAIAVREARAHTEDPPARVAIDGVLVLLDRAAAGGTVQRMAWDAAAAAPDVAGETAAADRMADAMLTALEHAITEGQESPTC